MNGTQLPNGEQVRRALATLRRGTGARCVLLVSRDGQVLAQSGHTDGLPLNSVISTVAAMTALTAQLGRRLEGGVGISLHDYEGERYHFYAAVAAGGPALLAVVSQHASAQRAGLVWLFMRRALEGLRSQWGIADGEVSRPAAGVPGAGALTTAQAQALGLLADGES